jgi:hypothetical protein
MPQKVFCDNARESREHGQSPTAHSAIRQRTRVLQEWPRNKP